MLRIFQEDDGKPSLKRIVGALMLINGLLGKDILCALAAFYTLSNFDKIDNSCDGMIYAGIGLVTGTVIEKIFVKK